VIERIIRHTVMDAKISWDLNLRTSTWNIHDTHIEHLAPSIGHLSRSVKILITFSALNVCLLEAFFRWEHCERARVLEGSRRLPLWLTRWRRNVIVFVCWDRIDHFEPLTAVACLKQACYGQWRSAGSSRPGRSSFWFVIKVGQYVSARLSIGYNVRHPG